MAGIIKYRGCSIIVHSEVTMDGGVLGSYEIVAESAETVAVFAVRGITRLHTVVEARAEGAAPPRSSDHEYLVEMAKCEIDFVLEISF
jgi:hypothetical protein